MPNTGSKGVALWIATRCHASSLFKLGAQAFLRLHHRCLRSPSWRAIRKLGHDPRLLPGALDGKGDHPSSGTVGFACPLEPVGELLPSRRPLQIRVQQRLQQLLQPAFSLPGSQAAALAPFELLELRGLEVRNRLADPEEERRPKIGLVLGLWLLRTDRLRKQDRLEKQKPLARVLPLGSHPEVVVRGCGFEHGFAAFVRGPHCLQAPVF